jgi:inner membrane protein
MDNLCHTLAGLAMGEAGLKRKAALGNATLMIAANLPDLDALAMFWGRTARLGFRRGWTHGILAMSVGPFVLAAVMLAGDRLRRHGNAAAAGAGATRYRDLLLLSALGVWSHPLLDLMNVYGVRLLMPFSDRWFYGDTLFIVDPWVWLALAVGIILARQAQRRGATSPFRAARFALGGVTAYILVMGALGLFGRIIVQRQMLRQGFEISSLMVAPVPLNPLPRDVVFVIPDGYGTARLTGLTPFWNGEEPQRRRSAESFARRAAATPLGRTYLAWARFPFFVPGGSDSCPTHHTCIRDMRYAPQSWAEVAIPDEGTLSSAASPGMRSHHDE